MRSHIERVLIAPNRRDVSWFHGWAKLFRIPNLFTVPGDQIAGFCLAGGLMSGRLSGLACALGSGLCLYAAGLATNDLADISEDAADRPWRPLATGLLDRTKVEWVSAGLLVLALVLAAMDGLTMLSVVALLVAAVLAYNTWFKRIPVLGELMMGACRALSLLLGSVAAVEQLPFPQGALMGAATTMSYIVVVSVVARNETRPERLTWMRWAPVVLCLGWTLVPLAKPDYFRDMLPAFLVPFLVVLFIASRATLGIGLDLRPPGGIKERRRSTLRVAAHVGSMIRALILVQAMLILIAVPSRTGIWVAVGVAALWLPSTWLGRTIPSS